MTYNIIRFFEDGRPSHTTRRRLSYDDARDYCRQPISQGVLRDGTRWFEGFKAVRRGTPRGTA